MSTEVPRYIKCGDQVPQDFKPVDIKQLLSLHDQGQTEPVPVSFDAIASAFTGETGLDLPNILVRQLGFSSLRWLLMHHPQSASTLWVGLKEPKDGLKEACSAIYFEKYIDYSKQENCSLSPYPNTVYPRSFSLASIGQGERPAIFAQYYLPYYANHLFRADIPIQEEDIQELKELMRSTLRTESDQSEVTEEERLNVLNATFPNIISYTDNKIPEAMFRLMGNPNPRCLNIRRVEEKSSETYNHYDFALSQRASLKAYGLHVFNPWIHKDLELIYHHKPNDDIILIRIDPNLSRRFTPKYPYFE